MLRVGETGRPRTPMGPEPLFDTARGEGCTKSGSRRAREQFTQVRATRMRKTLLLLWFDIEFLARERGEQQYTLTAS